MSKNKLLAWLVAVIICCGFLAACGDKPEQAAPPPTAPGVDEATAPAASPQPAAEPARPSVSVPSVAGVPELDPEAMVRIDDATRAASIDLNTQAMKSYKKKDYDKAVALFIAALEKNPANNVARFNLACTFSLKGDKEKSLGLLRQFQLTPDCRRCFIQLAKATTDKDFDAIRDDLEFAKITAGAADRLKLALKKANWISFKPDALAQNEFDYNASGLPVISADGKRIAVAYEAEVSERGGPNLFLKIFDVGIGVTIRSQTILGIEEGDELRIGEPDAKKLAAKIERRIDKAHRMMIGPEWQDFTVTTKVEDAGDLCGEEQQTIKLGNSTVVYSEPELTIINKNGHSLFKGKVPGWSAPGGGGSETGCSNPAYVSNAWVSGQHHTMLFRIFYCGMDMCEAPDGKYQIIKLE